MTPDGDQIVIPDTFKGIAFSEWLNIFLETSMEHAKAGDVAFAYENLENAHRANVFYHSHDASFAIHVCWFSGSRARTNACRGADECYSMCAAGQ